MRNTALTKRIDGLIQIASCVALAAAVTGCGITVVTTEARESGGTASAGGNGGAGTTSTGGTIGAGGAGGTGGVTTTTGGAGGSPPVKEITGACEVRDEYSSLPNFGDPDVGKGYAKQAVPGVNDLDGLAAACTDEVFQTLLAKHCAVSSNRVIPEILTFFPDGTPGAYKCGGDTCHFLDCP